MSRPFAPALRHTLALVALAALAACGGGGGGSDAGSTTPQAVADTSVTLQGVAAKGLLKGAKVEVLRINADGTTTLLKEGTTLADGSYALDGVPSGIAVLVKVSSVAGTQMVDEATGQLLTPPAGFVMRAAINTQPGGANSLQVTPYSEMAVAKAEKAAGGLNTNNIESANADVRSYLGFDVLGEKPEFTGKIGSNPANKAALALASISQLANTSTLAQGLGCTDTQPADRVKCVVGKMAQKGTANSDLADSLEKGKQKASTGYTGDVPPAPQPQPDALVPPAVRSDAISEAKGLISNVRSNAPFLGGTGTDTLEKRLTQVVNTLRVAANPVDDGSLELYQKAVDAVSMLANKAQEFQPGIFSMPSVAASAVRCTYFKEADIAVTNPTEATSAAEASALGCRLSYDHFTRPGATPGSVIWYAHQQGFRVVPGADASTYLVYSQVVEQRLKVSATGELTNDTSSPSYTVRLPAGSAALRAQVKFTRDANKAINAFDLQGDLAQSVANVMSGSAVKNTVAAAIQPVPSANGNGIVRVMVAGRFMASGGSRDSGLADLGSGSYIQTTLVNPDIVIGGAEKSFDQRDVHLVLSGSVGAAGMTGVLDITGFKATKDTTADPLPTKLAFRGVVKQSADITLFDGTIAATADSLSNFDEQQAYAAGNVLTSPQVTLAGNLYVPNRPLLQVNISLSSPAYGHYSVSGQYKQGTSSVILSASRWIEDDSKTFGTLSTPTGVTLKVVKGSELNKLTKNGVPIGVFDSSRSRIDYADGSFEQY